MQASQVQKHRRQLRRRSPTNVRARTPVPNRTEPAEGAAGAGVLWHSPGPGVSSPEMLCPQPQRAFPPGSPSTGPLMGSLDEASHELRELLGSTRGKQSPFEGNRPLSSVSTSAGPTPGPEDHGSPPHVPPGPTRMPHSSPATGEGANLSSQVRKIFVGGVPQDLNQDDLYTIFSEYGGVKKAWLQRYRTNGNAGSNPPHNHRGFGFIIFYEGSAVDQLLGKSFSRFIQLKDGRRLEVKRAVSTNDMMNSQASTTGSAPPQVQQNPLPTGAGWPGAAVQNTQPPWLPDSRAGPWLTQLPPQHQMMLNSVPWPGSTDSCAPAMMPQLPAPAYPAMAGQPFVNPANPRPQTVLLPPGGGLALPQGGAVGGVQQAPALAVAPGHCPNMLAVTQPMLAAATMGGAVSWPNQANVLYGGVVVQGAGFVQQSTPYC